MTDKMRESNMLQSRDFSSCMTRNFCNLKIKCEKKKKNGKNKIKCEWLFVLPEDASKTSPIRISFSARNFFWR